MAAIPSGNTAQTDGPTYSTKEVAARAGVTEHTVRKALREQRIKRCNAVSERPLFSQAELDRFVALHEKGAVRPKTIAIRAVPRPTEAMQIAKAEALSDLVSQGTQQGQFALEELRRTYESVRREREDLLRSKDLELERLRNRVEFLEKRSDDVSQAIVAIRESQYNDTIAQAEADNIRARGQEMLKVAKLAAPAVLARVLGGEKLNQGAFRGFVDSLTDAQRSKIFQVAGDVLNPEQAGVLMVLLSGWDEEAKQANDTLRPPPNEEPTPPEPPGLHGEQASAA